MDWYKGECFYKNMDPNNKEKGVKVRYLKWQSPRGSNAKDSFNQQSYVGKGTTFNKKLVGKNIILATFIDLLMFI